jgi:hypothetical protein
LELAVRIYLVLESLAGCHCQNTSCYKEETLGPEIAQVSIRAHWQPPMLGIYE